MDGGYRLPAGVRDRLGAALGGFRNRDAAMALAVFTARFWTAPKRLGEAFPIDRRALAPVAALGLSEARVRGAIRVLVSVGFLVPGCDAPSRYRRTSEGWRCKPILY